MILFPSFSYSLESFPHTTRIFFIQSAVIHFYILWILSVFYSTEIQICLMIILKSVYKVENISLVILYFKIKWFGFKKKI